VEGRTRINIVDTPGHADFGGEVERILSMVDGAIVLVDAAEGPMPQTKFVVGKALKVGLARSSRSTRSTVRTPRHEEVINEVFDLFAALDATDEQLDFPILYGSGRDGWMNVARKVRRTRASAPLSRPRAQACPEPPSVEEGPFRMIGTILEANPFLGRIITGRIIPARSSRTRPSRCCRPGRQAVETGRISKILAFRGIERTPIEKRHAGDIVAIAGLSKGTVADTFCDPSVTEPLQAQPIDPPTVTMSFIVNDSPLAGTEGDKVTSRVIRDRLLKEAEGNVALKIEEAAGKDSFYVSGRGELQLAVLIETMRREGFELVIVGENPRNEDIACNAVREKALTNFRSQGSGVATGLTPASKLSLERAIEYIASDELVEVTPKSLRLRKRILSNAARQKAEKSAKSGK
jgi:GTP-binding protein